MRNALAVVLFTALVTHAASGGPCAAASASTPRERAELWRGSLERFTAGHPNLTAEQTQLLAQAVNLGDDMAMPQRDERRQAAFARKATRFMERARQLFSNQELGALFSSMGPTQIWLAQMVPTTPWCDCPGNPCPGGECVAGCVSWEGTDGVRRVGLCRMPSEPGGAN